MSVTWEHPPKWGIDRANCLIVGIDWSEWDVDKEMDEFGSCTIAEIRELARNRAPQIEAWMKVRAPWRNRTGNARRGLTCSAIFGAVVSDSVELVCAHSVPYGPYLEAAHKTSVFDLVESYWVPKIQQDLNAMGSRISARAGWRRDR